MEKSKLEHFVCLLFIVELLQKAVHHVPCVVTKRRERHGNKTALYAVEVGSRVIDSALKRGVGSIANTSPNGNHATISVYTRNNQASATIKVAKSIRNSEEIFTSYGGSWYKLKDRTVSFVTKNTR
jgi:hypothetical protein